MPLRRISRKSIALALTIAGFSLVGCANRPTVVTAPCPQIPDPPQAAMKELPPPGWFSNQLRNELLTDTAEPTKSSR